MEPVIRRWLPLFLSISCLVPAVSAAAPADAALTGPVDARAWLARVQAAANGGNYQGVMVFSMNGTISSSRVMHFVVGEQVYEQIEALDGRQERVLRQNDTVHTLWPQARLAVIEKRETLSQRTATPQAVEPRALEQYEFKREAADRVAGRDAVVFLLEPRDALRYAQRLWADQATGLMLRADVLNLMAAGQGARTVLESTAFSEIVINMKAQPDLVLQEIKRLRKLDGYRVIRPQQRRTTLEGEGWTLARPVSGFTLAGCVRRGMETAGDEQPVLQAMFTDGLTHVSLFVEPFDAQRHSNGEMLAQQGATGTLMTRRGDFRITAVGDVPPATLKRLADALERRRP